MAEMIDSDFDEQNDSDSIVAYQYTDLQKAARAILAKATETANKKIEQAKKNIAELEEIMRKQGYDVGYEQGVAQGEIDGRKNGDAAARAEFEVKIGGLNGALQNVLRELNFRKQSIQAKAEADLLALSLEIAKKVVKREVEVDERFVVPLVMEAVALTNNRNDLLIKVNPADHKVIEDEIPTLEAIFNDIGRVSISDDESIQKGGVKVASRDGEVDLSLDEQFASLERALIGDIEGLEEWNGEQITMIPEEIPEEIVEATPTPPPAVEAPVTAPAPATAQDKNPAKPKVEPTRRRGPRTKKDNAPAGTEASSAKQTENKDTTTVHSQVDPALQSSLASVSSLEGLTLGSEEEAIIREVLESNIGDADA